VKADSTDPATLRPDICPETVAGSTFIPINCPDFPPQINLPPHIEPINAWGIFTLFLSEEQVQIIINHTNNHQNRPYDVLKPHSRACNWRPVCIAEVYAYSRVPQLFAQVRAHLTNQTQQLARSRD